MAAIVSAAVAVAAAVLGGGAQSTAQQPPEELASALTAAVAEYAHLFNTSFSLAIVNPGANGWEFETAAGVEDRQAGTLISSTTRIPVGSVTKAWTATRMMQLFEQGLLDLDTPAYHFIDPWLAKQDPPAGPLLALWNSDKRINQITVRQLMSMTSGLPDYNDSALQAWTEKNPDSDYLPMDFINEAAKQPFLFDPGAAGRSAYSGNGYVLLGMVLASVTNATTWDKLDQRVHTDSSYPSPLNNSIFMLSGKCSQYPRMAHQYVLQEPLLIKEKNHELRWKLQSSQEASLHRTWPGPPTGLVPRDGNSNAVCDEARWTPDEAWEGTLVTAFPSPSKEVCCSTANRPPFNYYENLGWTFYPNSWCLIYSYAGHPSTPTNHTSGAWSGEIGVPYPQSSWFKDIYGASCLNGWTMGNLATTSIDAARFFSQLSEGKIVSSASMAAMKPDHVFSEGFAACKTSPKTCLIYGLGFMRVPRIYAMPGPCTDPTNTNCVCDPASMKCYSLLDGYGHPGQDWGSGMPVAEFYPQFNNLTVSLATTSVSGMNTSLSIAQNSQFATNLTCVILQKVAAEVAPTFPVFSC